MKAAEAHGHRPRQRPRRPQPGGLTSHGRAIHDLVLGDGVILMVHVGARAGCLPLDDVDLHVLDLDPHQQEVDLPHDDVLQVVPTERKPSGVAADGIGLLDPERAPPARGWWARRVEATRAPVAPRLPRGANANALHWNQHHSHRRPTHAAASGSLSSLPGAITSTHFTGSGVRG